MKPKGFKTYLMKQISFLGAGLTLLSGALACQAQPVSTTIPDYSSRILTPPAPATPRINGPKIYGQRPGRPFLYTIPATGLRPMTFGASGLPRGLKLDPQTGSNHRFCGSGGRISRAFHRP